MFSVFLSQIVLLPSVDGGGFSAEKIRPRRRNRGFLFVWCNALPVAMFPLLGPAGDLEAKVE